MEKNISGQILIFVSWIGKRAQKSMTICMQFIHVPSLILEVFDEERPDRPDVEVTIDDTVNKVHDIVLTKYEMKTKEIIKMANI